MAPYLNLDWRDCPLPEVMANKIYESLSAYDSSGVLNLCLANSAKTKSLVKATGSPHGSTMYLQEHVLTSKRSQACTSVHAKAATKYIVRFYLAAVFVLHMIDALQPEEHRTIMYRLRGEEFKKDQIDQVFTDMALTIGVHPYCLGVRYALRTSVYVPTGARLVLEKVQNIFQYAIDKEKALIKQVIRECTRAFIPVMIDNLVIQGNIRAVVVMEHTNLLSHFEDADREKRPGHKGVLVVAVR